MCGQFGIMLGPRWREGMNEHQYLLLNSLLGIANDSRGGDSWGYAQWENPDAWEAPTIKKGMGKILGHVHSEFGVAAPIRIGHTRKATTGDVTAANSHPFEVGNLIVAHNGVVHNHKEAGEKHELKHKENYQVDSEILAHYLANKWPLDEVSAYGSLVWADKTAPNKILLGRFNSGQLAVFGFGPNIDETWGIAWSSNEDHLKTAVVGAGITQHFPFIVNENRIYVLEDAHMYDTKQDFKIKRYSTVVSTGYRGGENYNYHDWDSRNRTCGYGSHMSEEGSEKSTTKKLLNPVGGAKEEEKIDVKLLGKKDRRQLLRSRSRGLPLIETVNRLFLHGSERIIEGAVTTTGTEALVKDKDWTPEFAQKIIDLTLICREASVQIDGLYEFLEEFDACETCSKPWQMCYIPDLTVACMTCMRAFLMGKTDPMGVAESQCVSRTIIWGLAMEVKAAKKQRALRTQQTGGV